MLDTFKMATARSVKPWKLSEDETFSSYTSWQQNITYCLNQDKNCQPFLLNTTWTKISHNHPTRGLQDDAADGGLKKEQKLLNLNAMLGYICQFIPHYLASEVINLSTSINSVWGTIRQYYGFQQSEVQFLKFTNITWEGIHSERPERLYRRVLAHLQDNLLRAGTKLKHNGADVTTDDILRFLAKYKYIIKSDMTKQFFQLPMKKSSIKYLGILTPYKGLRVYTRAAMGMPGSTEHLDELMSRVLGDLMEQGIVKKIADDLYTGGNTIAELLHNWEQILHAFEWNNLRISASKTVICPITTTILGWIWSAGQIRPSTHKVTPLATSQPPSTIKGLRSWIGAFKHLKPPLLCSLISPGNRNRR